MQIPFPSQFNTSENQQVFLYLQQTRDGVMALIYGHKTEIILLLKLLHSNQDSKIKRILKIYNNVGNNYTLKA